MSGKLRRGLAVSGVVLALVVLGGTGRAAAHPLGNFTVNVYGGLVVGVDRVLVDYVVDMAEIPAFQERRTVDGDGDDTITEREAAAYRTATCAALARGIEVRSDAHRVLLSSTDRSSLTFPPGSGGLSTLRLECTFEAPLTTAAGSVSVDYEDRNFPGRLGWREVAVYGDGTTIIRTDAERSSLSDRLQAYPQNGATSAQRKATVEVRSGGPAYPLPVLADAPSRSVGSGAPDGGILASLVGRDDLGPLAVVAMFLVALTVGALHALGPGHGKTLIGGYLVAGRATMRHAVAVGVAIALMHTASVIGLGLLVVSAERYFAPERVYPWLGVASGLVAVALGTHLLISRVHTLALRPVPGSRPGDDDHGHEHGHDHGSAHVHAHPEPPATDAPISRRGLTALAFSGGILPSPSALVVLLASMALGRAFLGLALIVAFSVGLAGTLIGVGSVAVKARGLAERHIAGRAARLLPVASAGAIAVMGAFLTVNGITQL